MTQVPFAEAGSGVALCLEQLGDGDLVGLQAAFGIGKKHAAITAHAIARRKPAGEQCRPAGRADFGSRVELRQLHPFAGHAVEVGRAIVGWP